MHISNYILILQANPPYRCIPCLFVKIGDTFLFRVDYSLLHDLLMLQVNQVPPFAIKSRVANFYPTGEPIPSHLLRCALFAVEYYGFRAHNLKLQ